MSHIESNNCSNSLINSRCAQDLQQASHIMIHQSNFAEQRVPQHMHVMSRARKWHATLHMHKWHAIQAFTEGMSVHLAAPCTCANIQQALRQLIKGAYIPSCMYIPSYTG